MEDAEQARTPLFDPALFPALWPEQHAGGEPISKGNLLRARQDALNSVSEAHDANVRELYHLVQFGDMLEFDPATARQDSSAAFEKFSRDHDLYSMVEPDLYSAAPVSRKRTTRRAAHDRMDELGLTQRSPVASTSKAAAPKRARKSEPIKEPEQVDFTLVVQSYKEPKPKAARGRGKPRGGRASTSRRAKEEPDEAEDPMELDETELPTPEPYVEIEAPDKAIPPLPAPKSKTAPEKKPVKRKPAVSPFLAPLKRICLEIPDETERPEPPVPQSYLQVLPEADFNSIEDYLSSYMSIEDVTGNDERPRDLTNKITNEAKAFDRITTFRNDGRLASMNPDKRYRDKERLRIKTGDHQDHVRDHACDFAKRLADERRHHMALGKRISKMIVTYYEELEGREERKKEAEQKRMKALAKSVAKEVWRKWSMAADIIRAQYQAKAEEEAEREGRQKLNKILDQSSKFLKSRREDLMGSDDDSGDSMSDRSLDDDDDEAGSDAEGDGSERPSMSREVSSAAPDRGRGTVSMSREPSMAANGGSDVDFASGDEEQRQDDDAAMALEMEAEEEQEIKAEESDEDAGLAKDADMPIEELLRKYGYRSSPPPEVDASESREESEAPIADGPNGDVDMPPVDHQEEPVEGVILQATGPIGAPAPRGDVDFADDEVMAAVLENEDLDLDAAMDSDEAQSGDDDEEMRALQQDADKPLDDEFLAEYLRVRAEEEQQKLQVDSTATSDQAKDELSAAASGSEAAESEAEAADEQASTASGQSAEPKVEEEEERIKVVLPFLLRGTLRPYQKAGLDWLASLYQNGLNGILADEMGLGKTIQTISLLAWLACEKGIWGPHLIIVPTSVMLNWEMEFKKFLPGFKVLTYYGSGKERQAKRKGWNKPNQFHVVITSYQIVLSDQHIFRRKTWHYMILDEAHHIKNFRSQRWQTLLTFHSKKRLLLTGTPLQNNLMELWSLLYFLMPGGLKDGPFANHQEFQDWFSNPMDKAIETNAPLDAESRATVGRLHTILRPYLLRRLKSEVEKEMPGKYEHVMQVRLSKRQRFLYDEFMSRAATKETLSGGSFISIVNCLMQLRKVCNHPDLFEVREVRTSLALDKSVAEDFSIEDLLVRKHLLRNFEDSEVLEYFNLEPSNSLHAAVARCHLSASQALHDKLTQELGPEPADKPLTVRTAKGWAAYLKRQRYVASQRKIDRITAINARRTVQEPVYPAELVDSTRIAPLSDVTQAVQNMVKGDPQRAAMMSDVIKRFAFATPNAKARGIDDLFLPASLRETEREEEEDLFEPFHLASTKLAIAFPDLSLIQYDCGKLQVLADLLRQFQANGQRVLIFTQMTKVLDILEIFLSWLGHRYLRLDGSTKVEDRQIITERFNRDERIMAFISSTRAGGLGINLTGASCVVFYDSDWNPAMDRQCQDRCHRIGQTRDVHIYRLVCTNTIEENMLKKANQKRRLEGVIISEGDFTTEYFSKTDWRDMLEDDADAPRRPTNPLEGEEQETAEQRRHFDKEMRAALMDAEDEVDQQAAQEAEGELVLDEDDFEDEPEGKGNGGEDELDGTVDKWMLVFLDRDENEDLFEDL